MEIAIMPKKSKTLKISVSNGKQVFDVSYLTLPRYRELRDQQLNILSQLNENNEAQTKVFLEDLAKIDAELSALRQQNK